MQVPPATAIKAHFWIPLITATLHYARSNQLDLICDHSATVPEEPRSMTVKALSTELIHSHGMAHSDDHKVLPCPPIEPIISLLCPIMAGLLLPMYWPKTNSNSLIQSTWHLQSCIHERTGGQNCQIAP